MNVTNPIKSTTSGFFWSFLDIFSKQIVTFIVGIILARLLDPSEFGLIGLLTIIVAVSQTIVDSGLTQALIRKRECTEMDYSSVFVFNLILSILIYIVIYICSPLIAEFFNEPKLKYLTRVIGTNIIVGSFSLVQRVKLTRVLNFKLQTKVSLVATIISGFVGIYLAYFGYGVWSLVVRILVETILITILLIGFNKWVPSFKFRVVVFFELFAFSSKLLVSSLLDTIYKNIYMLIIGKSFSMTELGYYTRAQMFQKVSAQNLTSVVQRVSFPLLSRIKEDTTSLKEAFRMLILRTMYVSFAVTMGLAAISEALILAILGDNWRRSVLILQLLCLAGLFYPLHAINLNILNVLGHSGKFLKLEIIKKLLVLPVILLGVKFGMTYLLIGMIVNSVLVLFVNGYYSKQLIGYSILAQMKDISRSLVLIASISLCVFSIPKYFEFSDIVMLTIQSGLYITLIILLSEVLKVSEYIFIRNQVVTLLKRSMIITRLF